jgi:Circularly permutated YpsA SLOG family
MLSAVISGGQTGADRAALDVALALGIPHRGWVPKGRRDENGTIPALYAGLIESDSADAAVRTRLNVRDSDATVILSHGALAGGSALTADVARELGRPCLHLDLGTGGVQAAASTLVAWLAANSFSRLNVAGPRASEDPEIYGVALTVLRLALTALTERPGERLVNGWRVAGAVVGERNASTCQDRAAVVPIDGGVVVVVADGAGGRGGGAQAADGVIEAVTVAAMGRAADPWRADTWVEVLRRADAEVAAAGHGGESTAVALALGPQIAGASVGDSAAWLLESSGAVELTRGQQRRPVIGSGSAAVMPIAHDARGSTVLLASDGFAKYAPPGKAAPIALGVDLVHAVDGLIDLVRLRSGSLQDDVTVVLCRAEPG